MAPSDHSGYRVLARKYRPQTLEDLIGQETLVQVLSNAIELKRLPHAFILTGVRGVGKTTSARIIARMLNCIGADGQGQETVTPCGVCAQCRAILEDRHIDVIEMDAASRTGVDDIREVIDGARYKAAFGRYKVYIIDEVHMLSKNAFNALLKTLEEPPAHVKFIFATTEIKKVPDTVLSRCVRFELRRFNETDLLKLFNRVLEKENLSAEPGALKLLARAAQGSARDGLSLLDQALSLGDQHVREEAVRQMLNLADRKEVIMLFDQLLTGQIQAAIQFLDTYYASGRDPLNLLNELLAICHWLSLLKVDPALDDDELTSAEEKQVALEIANRTTVPVLTRFWQVLLKGIQEVNIAPSALQGAQMIFIRLAYMASMPTPHQIVQNLINEPAASTATAPAAAVKTITQPIPIARSAPATSTIVPMPPTYKDLVSLVGQKREPLLQASLHHDVHLIEYQPGQIKLRLTTLAPRDFIAKLREKLNLWTGQPWQIEVMDEGGDHTLEEQKQFEKKQMISKIQENPLVKKVFQAPLLKKLKNKKRRALSEKYWPIYETSPTTPG
jgi:DNA polymerase-3 subunit gamma/tau